MVNQQSPPTTKSVLLLALYLCISFILIVLIQGQLRTEQPKPGVHSELSPESGQQLSSTDPNTPASENQMPKAELTDLVTQLETELERLDQQWAEFAHQRSIDEQSEQERVVGGIDQMIEQYNALSEEQRSSLDFRDQLNARMGLGVPFITAFADSPQDWAFEREQHAVLQLMSHDDIGAEHFAGFSCHQSLCSLRFSGVNLDVQSILSGQHMAFFRSSEIGSDIKSGISSSPSNETVEVRFGRTLSGGNGHE